MRWQHGRRSGNVEDRRGIKASTKAGGGVLGIIVVLVALYFGVDPAIITSQLETGAGSGAPPEQAAPRSPEEDRLAEFVSVVLADTEDTWQTLFKASGKTYRVPKLVLFTDAVDSACGFAEAATGPFYCPADQKVYIDLGFFRDLQARFKAPGDFAQAYVIAHEVGHHVQNLLGISGKMRQAQQKVDKVAANKLLVRLELQADCLAGVWAQHADKTRQILEQGDVEEALGAASAIGDDRLQRQATGRVTPDSFTHGTSAQRARWFKQGLAGGSLSACDTFGAGVEL